MEKMMEKVCENCKWFEFDPLLDNKNIPGGCALDEETVSPKNHCDFYDEDSEKGKRG
jgi:hypothetical protein